jgi:hypothetical protein
MESGLDHTGSVKSAAQTPPHQVISSEFLQDSDGGSNLNGAHLHIIVLNWSIPSCLTSLWHRGEQAPWRCVLEAFHALAELPSTDGAGTEICQRRMRCMSLCSVYACVC